MDSLYNFNLSLTGLSDETLFQIYCLNPPSDNCDHGPCPNADITGIGQQISIYVTGVSFSITMLHNRKAFRLSAYAYLLNIYAIFISTFVAIFRLGITPNDGVFIILLTVSPPQICLWLIGLASLIPRLSHRLRLSKLFPTSMADRPWEERFINLASLLSLGIWICLLCLILTTPSSLLFIQPNCKSLYNEAEWLQILWAPFFVARSILFYISVGFMVYLPPILGRYFHRTATKSEEVGILITSDAWSPLDNDPVAKTLRQGCKYIFETSSNNEPRVSNLALLIIQLIPLTPCYISTSFDFLEGLDIANILIGFLSLILSSLLFWYARSNSSSDSFMKRMTKRRRGLLLTIVIMLLLQATNFFVGLITITPSDVFNFFVFLRVPFTCRKEHGKALQWYIITGAFFLLLPAVAKTVAISSHIFVLELLAGNLNFPSTQIALCILWQCYTSSMEGKWYIRDMESMWKLIIEPHSIFKFLFFIVNPNMAWIQSTIASNPAITNSFSFGQIFSATAALLSLFSQKDLILFLYHKLLDLGKVSGRGPNANRERGGLEMVTYTAYWSR